MLDRSRVLGVIVLLGILAVSGVSDAAELPFSFRKSITIDHTKVSGSTDLTDFPLLFSVTDNDLKTTEHVTSATGDDILFRALDDATCGGVGMAPCTLDHEIETYNGTTGELVAWVRIPSLSATSDTTLYIYYGNSDITAPIENPTGVWISDFAFVQHFRDDPTGSPPQMLDSTTHNIDGTTNGGVAATTGQIGGALFFDGSNDYVDIDSITPHSYGDLTISVWYRSTSSAVSDDQYIFVHGHDPTFFDDDSVTFGPTDDSGHQDRLRFLLTRSEAEFYYYGTSDIVDQQWHYLVAVRGGGRVKLYVDGVEEIDVADLDPGNTVVINDITARAFIGDNPGNTEQVDGPLDELRLLDDDRSGDWVLTTYNNQKWPNKTDFPTNGFLTVGVEESTPPTAVTLLSFSATRHQGGVLLHWRAGYDIDNLGWHVYREAAGERVRVTPGLIAGSALMWGPGIRLRAGNSYRWWDPAGLETDRYWIEERDLDGQRTIHGPVTPVVTDQLFPSQRHSTLLSQVGRKQTSRTKARTMVDTRRVQYQSRTSVHQVVTSSQTPQPWETPDLPPGTVQHTLSSAPAIKLAIRETGWYRVTQPELVAAGLDPGVDPRQLQLFVDGYRPSIAVVGEEDGHFGPQDAIEFYGVALDTPWTDTHTYWLVVGSQPGNRMQVASSPTQKTAPPQSFPFTVERKDRSLYLATVRNGEAENFFGAVVAQESVEHVLTLHHLDLDPSEDARLEVVLQGVTTGVHQVIVQLNGHEVGTITFPGQGREGVAFPILQGWLQEGENVVTLVPIDDEEVSVVDAIRLTYSHTYTADDDRLHFTAPGQSQITLTSFSQPNIHVVDVTEPHAVRQLVGYVTSQGTTYAMTVTAAGEGERNLLAFTNEQVKQSVAITANTPSTWHHQTQSADLVIISHGTFMDGVTPLKTVRESQGWRVALIDVEDIYDEFNFGAKSPRALRHFLHHASTVWQTPPRFVLLIGDASFDPRNYLELDDVDFLPTTFVGTAFLETASDDALVDFDEDGVPELAVGRLPVQTLEEATTVVAKLVNYAQTGSAGSWTREALLVADNKDVFDFAAANEDVATLLSSDLTVESLLHDRIDAASLRSELLRRLNEGKLLVNYIGHGSVEVWGRGEFLTSADVRNLTNGARLPLVVAMNCLNGFFHDLYTESLAEALLKAEQGGAVAVWASSGLTAPSGQAVMNQELVRQLFGEEALTLGEAIIQAKAAATDRDVQRTWMLFGDPTLRLK